MPDNVRELGVQGYATQVAQTKQAGTAKPGSVFSLLQLDPLSGLDPATREIAQTRLWAERALYVSQKMPMVLRWEAELLSVHAAELPAVRQLVTNATQFTASAECLARVAEQLPGQVSTARYEAKFDFERDNNLTQSVRLQIAKQLNRPPLGFSLAIKKPFDNGAFAGNGLKEFQVNFMITYFFR